MAGYTHDDFENDAEFLYRHFRTIRKVESHSKLIDRFRRLFIEGFGYPEPAIQSALYRIVNSKWANWSFSAILNRCCYILINDWSHKKTETEKIGLEAIAGLVALFNNLPTTDIDSSVVLRLRQLVQQFTQTEEHQALQRRVWADKEPPKTRQDAQTRPIGELIGRYPFIHSHYLLDYDSCEWGQRVIKKRQEQQEKRFETQLLRYASYLRQRSQRQETVSIVVVENPTLLSDQHLKAAIRKFVDKAATSQTFQDSVRKSRLSQDLSYSAFKQCIQKDLTTFVREAHRAKHSEATFDYAGHRFQRWLQERLREIQPESNDRQLTDALRVQTCAELLDCFLAHPCDRAGHHLMFIDLIGVLGATDTIGLLLKIVLLCQGESNLEAIKLHLSKRLAELFKYYERSVSITGGAAWLIDCLENWMVAGSIRFSKIGATQWWTVLLDKPSPSSKAPPSTDR